MARERSKKSYWLPLLGLSSVIAGVVAVGMMLTAAGGEAGWASPVVLTVLSVVLIAGGFWLFASGGKGQGGWRQAKLDREQERAYREEFSAAGDQPEVSRWRRRRRVDRSLE